MFVSLRGTAAAVAVLSIAFALSACGGAEARRESHMKRGEAFLAEGKLEKAQVEFRNALQIDPNDIPARLAAARVAEKLRDVRAAAGMYQSVIDADAENVEARANLARIYLFSGAPDRALELVEPALLKHPEDPELLTVRGAARMQKKDPAGALADAEHAVKVAPDNENAVALLASLYRQKGETGQAIELIEGVLKKSQSVDLHQVLANLYVTAEKPERAEAELRKVVELRPDELSHRYQLALFYTRLKRVDDAERVLKEAIASQPEKDEPKLAYVEFLTAQRSPAAGEQALAEFIQQEPKDYDLQLGLGALQQKKGDTEQALETYRTIVAKADDAPQGLAARNRIAAVLVSQQKLDEASKLINEVLEKNPRDNDALVMRGNIALERKDSAAAITDLRAVLRDQPDSIPVMRALARAHLINGETALAEENLRAAMQAAPQNTAVRLELAQLLMQTQRTEPAVALLEEAVKAAPNDAPVREALARAYLSQGDFDAARRSAEDLKILLPDRAIGSYLAGLVAQAQGRNDEARKEMENAMRLQPNAADALAALVRLDLSTGKTPEAIARVRAAVAADPQNVAARNLLGETYLSQKDYANAAKEFETATRLMPKWWVPHRNVALTKLAAGDVNGGIKVYEAAVRATNYEPALVTDLATLYERQRRIDDAIAQYETLHERNPHLQLAANNLAMLLVTYKTDRASLDRAQDLTAAFADSEDPALLDTHGWVRLKRGEITEALPVLEKAVQRAPESAVIRYHLAMAQVKAGQRDKAKSNLEAALDGATGFAGIDEARSTLAELNGRASG